MTVGHGMGLADGTSVGFLVGVGVGATDCSDWITGSFVGDSVSTFASPNTVVDPIVGVAVVGYLGDVVGDAATGAAGGVKLWPDEI